VGVTGGERPVAEAVVAEEGAEGDRAGKGKKPGVSMLVARRSTLVGSWSELVVWVIQGWSSLRSLHP
jgi:hypothetical protein